MGLKANLGAQQRSMPTITSLKMAGDNLVISTAADTPQDVVDYVDQLCGDCSKLCGECGNAAYRPPAPEAIVSMDQRPIMH